MEYRPLKLTVISAEGIKDVNMFSKMDVYAAVSIEGYPNSKKKTFIDKDCGTHPKWNDRLELIVDEPFLTKPGTCLLIQLFAESTIGSDKEIGSVSVLLDGLFKENPAPEGEEKVMEYQVRTTSGKNKGSLKISFKFGEKFTHQTEAKNPAADQPVAAYPAHPPPPYATGSSYAAAPYPGMGYPPPQQYPPAAYPGYPQPGGYGYPPPQPGYGYPPPPAGYAAYPHGQDQKKNKMGGMGAVGLGVGAGLLGGLVVGEMVSDIGDSAAYAEGYGDAMGDMGDF